MRNRMSVYAAGLLVLVVLFGGSFAVFAGENSIFLPTVLKNSGGTIPLPTGTSTATPTVTPTPTATQQWPEIALQEVASGFDQPVHVTHAGDGSGRLFVVEQPGTLRIVEDGERVDTPFLDITDRVRCCNERGLLSVVFPPGFDGSGHFYVDYTAEIEGQLTTRVSRFQVTDDANVADPDSEQIVLSIDQPYTNHNGGQLAFGPDSYLYIGMGDGGSGGDPQDNGQSLDRLLGKLLRIDVETGDPLTYTIPAGNPFIADPDARGEIWAYGLRNPWRFSFDRQTGDLYIGDVGQGKWEEIDFQPANSDGGENYGWNIMEGNHCYGADTCDQAGLTLPIWEYDHDLGRSVTGGFVYRGASYPSMQGFYFYADFSSGRIWGLQRRDERWANQFLLDSGFSVSSFGEDEAGELYLVDYGGTIYRVVPAAQ